MNKEEFYRKYANLALEKRMESKTFIKNGTAHSLTMLDIYKLINGLDEERMRIEIEIQKYLDSVKIYLK